MKYIHWMQAYVTDTSLSSHMHSSVVYAYNDYVSLHHHHRRLFFNETSCLSLIGLLNSFTP